jgi:serum/glucocorticoid-regulated kinase 2
MEPQTQAGTGFKKADAYLHSLKIAYRDIKPENLVFDEHGYLRITDLGIARVWNP